MSFTKSLPPKQETPPVTDLARSNWASSKGSIVRIYKDSTRPSSTSTDPICDDIWQSLLTTHWSEHIAYCCFVSTHFAFIFSCYWIILRDHGAHRISSLFSTFKPCFALHFFYPKYFWISHIVTQLPLYYSFGSFVFINWFLPKYIHIS